jgi:hypothetical protein
MEWLLDPENKNSDKTMRVVARRSDGGFDLHELKFTGAVTDAEMEHLLKACRKEFQGRKANTATRLRAIGLTVEESNGKLQYKSTTIR